MTDNYYLGRYGMVTLSDKEKLVQYTELNAPDINGNKAYLETVKRSQIILDDGSTKQNPATVLGRNGQDLSASNSLRAGDSTPAIEGILDHFIDTAAGEHQTSYRCSRCKSRSSAVPRAPRWPTCSKRWAARRSRSLRPTC
ncbi:hypothetical protein [Comamonas sp. JC664]|uniref:hypothetical protein n=1 Tax=Comamonas sp. JC664 TaxID=2801917 RepID=UPI00360DEE0D